MSGGGYDGLKAFAFTIGITVIIFLVLYAAKRRRTQLVDPDASRRHSWYIRSSDDLPEARHDGGRPPLGEKPIMQDVWIAPRFPLCLRRESQSERLGLGQGKDEKRDASCAANDENKPEWRGFLVSYILSINYLRP